MAGESKTVLERLFGGASKSSADASQASMGADPGAPSLAALRSQAKKARNRPVAAQTAVDDAAQQQMLDELFETENWEVLSSLYFDLRFAMTGFEYFKLTEKQQRILGKTMGTCMRVLLQIDPRYVALIVFATNFGAYAADKEMAWHRAWKEWEAKQVLDRTAQRNGQGV